MKFRKSELLFIFLVMSEIIIIPLVYARLRSGEPLFPVVYERDYEVMRKGPCSTYQRPYPTDAYEAFKKNVDVTAPDGRKLCLTVLTPADVQWKFSPDGQYLLMIIHSTHSYGYRLFEVSTTKELCSNYTDMEGRYMVQPYACPVLKLADGRWWKGDFSNIFLKTGDPNIWSLVNSTTEVSPDGEWMVGQAGGWYLARTNGKLLTRYSMPYPYGSVSANMPPCGYNGYYAIVWRSDSKQFAVIQPGDKNVFVWSIQEDGSVHLDSQTAVEKCSSLLELTPEGKAITRPIYP